MAGLERIVGILVDKYDELKNRKIDLSMFPKEEAQKIYALAAERALQQGNFDAVSRYLLEGKQWERMLELGVPLFRSEDAALKEQGQKLLITLEYQHGKLPEDVAIELADSILARMGEHNYEIMIL